MSTFTEPQKEKIRHAGEILWRAKKKADLFYRKKDNVISNGDHPAKKKAIKETLEQARSAH